MLQYCFNWKTLSAVAGVTFWNFYFQLHPGAIRAPQVVEFLDAQRAFNEAMQTYINARANYARSLYELETVTAASIAGRER